MSDNNINEYPHGIEPINIPNPIGIVGASLSKAFFSFSNLLLGTGSNKAILRKSIDFVGHTSVGFLFKEGVETIYELASDGLNTAIQASIAVELDSLNLEDGAYHLVRYGSDKSALFQKQGSEFVEVDYPNLPVDYDAPVGDFEYQGINENGREREEKQLLLFFSLKRPLTSFKRAAARIEGLGKGWDIKQGFMAFDAVKKERWVAKDNFIYQTKTFCNKNH